MNRVSVPFFVKSLSESGQFEGYASVFNNVDLGGDVIAPDAFKELVTNQDGKVVILLQHDPDGLPLGKASVSQDERGLKFTGELVMEDPQVRRVYAHMRAKTLTGMSIGFDILPGGAEILESGVRKLTALKLWEISVVVWGMNPQAQITDVKTSAPEVFGTKTDLEVYLRKVGKFSHSQAKALAAGGYKALATPRKADSDAAELVRQLDALSSKIINPLS